MTNPIERRVVATLQTMLDLSARSMGFGQSMLDQMELVIEARSPSNRRSQERRKRQAYFDNGVQIVLDVDAENRMIRVYHANAPSRPTRYGIEDRLDCEPLLPGWRRALVDIFAEQASAKAVAGEVAVAWHAEGVEIGLAQRNTEVAQAVLEEGMSVTVIAKITGLPEAEIAKLKR
jgi:hypothetical protein